MRHFAPFALAVAHALAGCSAELPAAPPAVAPPATTGPPPSVAKAAAVVGRPAGVPEACYGATLTLNELTEPCTADAGAAPVDVAPDVKLELAAASTIVAPGADLAIGVRIVNTSAENRELWVQKPFKFGGIASDPSRRGLRAFDDKARDVDQPPDLGLGGGGSGPSTKLTWARVVLPPHGVLTTNLRWTAVGYDPDLPPPPPPPPKPAAKKNAPSLPAAARPLTPADIGGVSTISSAFGKLKPGAYRVVVTVPVKGLRPGEMAVAVAKP